MAENRKDLTTKLANAHEQLKKAQTRVADLEAQLSGDRPNEAVRLTNEDRYHHLLDNLLESAEIIGFDWRYLYVNDTATSHGRQPKEVLLRSTVIELYPGIENTEMFAHFRTCMEERIPQHFEARYVFPDGVASWFESSVQPVPEGIFILSLDITERKLAEKAEQEQRQFAEALRDSLAALTSSLDVGTVMSQILDQAANVVPNDSASIIQFEGDVARVLCNRGFSLEANDFFFDFANSMPITEYFSLIRDGKPYCVHDTHLVPSWTRISVTAWIRSTIGVPILIRGGVLGVLTIDSATPNRYTPADVERLQVFARYAALALENAYHTASLEQKVIERTAELNEAKERAEAILNNSTDGILLLHPNLTIQQTNFSFNRLFGCGPDTYFGESLIALIHADDVNLVSKTIRVVIGERHGKSIEIRLLRKDGTVFDAELSIGHIKDDGLVCTIRDITERKAQERQLRYHASLQENVSDAVIVTDMEFRIQSWNKAAERIYGWSAEEIVNKSDVTILRNEFSPPDSRERSRQQLREQGWWQGEVSQRHKDGSIRHVLGSVNLVKDENGLPFSIIAVNHDITERKQAEDALRESEGLYHLLADTIRDVVIRLKPNFDYLYVSPSSRTVLGYEPEELLGPSDFRRIHPDDAPAIRELSKRLVEQPGGASISYRFWHKQGHYIWLESTGQAIVSEQTGEVIEFVFTARDVTKRKATEEALRASEVRYRLLAENVSDVIAKVSPDGIRTFITPSCFALLGYTPEEVIGRPALEIIHPDDHLETKLTVMQAVNSAKASFTLTQRLRHKAGHYIWVEVTSGLVRDPDTGAVVELIGVIRDISERRRTEAALRESEERYHLIADVASEGIMLADSDARITYVNPRMSVLCGYEPEEMIGREYFEFIHPSMQESSRQRFEERRAGVRGKRDILMQHKDGSNLWAYVSTAPVFGAYGKFQGVLSMFTDIAERKQAEDALRESEEKFRSLLDAAPIATIISDQMGRITLVNVQAETLFGFNRTELVGQMVEILIPEVVRDTHVHNRTAYVAAPHIRQSMEVFARRKDTSEFPVEIELSYIETKEGIMVMSFVIDITERKRANDELERQSTFLRNVIDVSPSMIFVKDYDARFVLVNPIVAKMLNTTVEALIGKSDADFNPSLQEVDNFLAGDRQVITSGETLFVEEPVTNSDGETHWFQTTKVPIISVDGKSKYVLGVSTDITERRKSEEALRQALQKEKELGELKTRFVSMASHEFRTPLATILALTETLMAYRHRLQDSEIEQRLLKIQDQVGHLKDVMEDVLLLARMQARRVEFSPTKINLDSLCRSVIDEFQGHPDVTHRLIYSCDEQLHEVILDKKLMRQIINNLVSNAVKYSSAESLIIISLEFENSTLILKVKDQGIGIPEAALKHLFEPFHRAENVGAISGTGLGMVITKESVDLHNGTITVESQVGIGTTFTVSIPLLEMDMPK